MVSWLPSQSSPSVPLQWGQSCLHALASVRRGRNQLLDSYQHVHDVETNKSLHCQGRHRAHVGMIDWPMVKVELSVDGMVDEWTVEVEEEDAACCYYDQMVDVWWQWLWLWQQLRWWRGKKQR